MFELLTTMVERLGIIVTIAFILTRFKFFRDMTYQEQLKRSQQYTAILFFGFFGIIGTYTGLSLSTESLHFHRWASNLAADEAIANSRVIGVVIAGLLGGYKVGIGAGLIAGIHRFTLGGFTAIACGLASIIAGILAGYFHRRNHHIKLKSAFFMGALAETIQMLIILLLSRPFEQAWTLVEIIGFPMIIANGLGCALFLLVIRNVVQEEEKVVAVQAQKIFRIADQTLAHLRDGINPKSAHAVCQILHNEIKASAVSMTNLTDILAHVGLGDDHHRAESPIQTQITLDAIHKGKMIVANQESIQCRVKGCPLGAAIIEPLKVRDKTIGTLKFYFRSEKAITNVDVELISGLSRIISNQLEIVEAERSYQLAKEAEIMALQAQISPHFLFNTLNTIVSLIRIDQTKARKLLVSLSHFLRQNLTVTTHNMGTLEQEIKHTKAYLSIEEARFIDRLEVIYDIDETVLLKSLPPLTLQPIVENAIKHGFKDKENNCIIKISIKRQEEHIQIKVEDNGQGMSEERVQQIGTALVQSEKGTGLALYNVNRRLIMTFGEDAALAIKSEAQIGTEVSFLIPYKKEVI
ncbi:sensor histidine kinase [Mesobacillus maritimus]|uniref:sensor histidine kinase n=1 Tax=Mesobacillus maritimus TaxID=1643336 RepID=UPI00203AA8E7|nr:sensor histidine kinase [Mesobacillus maritimus]MCM3585627.1 sensor histidine kinase [Mesobacillus maritimus]